MLSRIASAGYDPALINQKTFCIFGVGGLGVLVAEMLVRAGAGKLILVDRDVVGPENLNRLGYDAKDIGKAKVDALAEKLQELAKIRGQGFPLNVEKYFVDVIAWDKLNHLIKRCDIILTCFDNLEARLEVNYWAIKNRKVLIDGGTSENGLRGRVITVIPYKTPCLGCYFDDTTLYTLNEEESGSCNASLPTTMAIIAAIQVEMALKLLHNKKVTPRINVNLENGVNVVEIHDVKRRRNCRFCGGVHE